MNLIFSGKSVDECLEHASKELNVLKEKIKYKVVKEKHSLFGKTFEIEVISTELDLSDSNEIVNYKRGINVKETNEEQPKETTNNTDKENKIGVEVCDGKIIVNQNSEEKLGDITIKSCEGIKLFINGNICNDRMSYKITEYDKIEYKAEKIECERNVSTTISKDKMEAFISIKYIPEYKYKLKDSPLTKNLTLRATRFKCELPKKYTITEIKEILRQNKITEGIIYKNLMEVCTSGSDENVLIAKGIAAIDDIPSEVKLLLELVEKNIIDENSKENIDYRNLYSISNIEEGQILAQIIPAQTGQDGKNVCGEILKKKSIKSKIIKTGDGCKIEDNKIIATKTGRPSTKNGIFSVNNMYKIQDVDMKSGNLNFIGDLDITGNVNEGMTVKSGNYITIGKNVEVSTIIAGGDINIKGSSIKSTILTGQVDMEKKMYLEKLNDYKDNITKLISAVNKLDESSNNSRKISELVKILIENRYKDIPRLSLSIITHNICEDSYESELVNFIRNKMMGLNISKINSVNDLDTLKELIEDQIDFFEDDMIIPADIYLGYCQNCIVKSTGSITITGKGEYVSTLTALKDIIFTRNDAVARGGTLSARGNIKLGIVGSPSGVTTKLEVLSDGIITANIAYNNTVFCFGKRFKKLDVSGKNVRAYMKEDGEVVIDKFVL